VRQELAFHYRSEERSAKRRIQTEGGHTDAVDILLTDIRVVIEYDGAYFHRGSASARNDAAKAERLRSSGWTVIRVREQPLERLDDSDVEVAARASVHAVVVAVLEQIERLTETQAGGLADYRDAGKPRTPRPSKDRGADDVGLTEILDALCGPGWRKSQDKLQNLSAATVLARAAFLEDVFGARWRDYPSLLGCTPASLQTKIERFDRDYGLIWRKKPSLLGRNPETLARNAAYLDEVFGNRRWLVCLWLLTMDPETLRPRVTALDQWRGDRGWIEIPQLLGRNPKQLAKTTAFNDHLFGDKRWRKQVGLVGRNIETQKAKLKGLNTLLPDGSWRSRPQLLKLSLKLLQEKAAVWAKLTTGGPLRASVLTLSVETMNRRARELKEKIGPRAAKRLLRESPYLLEDPRALARRVARMQAPDLSRRPLSSPPS
jgi:very-short-patch-repair endonuclease